MASSPDDSKRASIMDPTIDDSKAASVVDPATDGSKTASVIDPDVDLEKRELNVVDQSKGAKKPNEFQRGISDTKWFLCCFGLYLGAFLYGKHSIWPLSEYLLINLAQVLIQPLLQMSKLPFSHPLAKLKN
jgi:hypothetical protein